MTVQTAPTTPDRAAATPGGGRILAVTRLLLVNRFSVFGIPWMIIGFILLVNLVIWWIVFSNTDPTSAADAQEGLQYSGASFYVFVYAMVLGIQAVAFTFPLALGLSATRRDFWAGASVDFVLVSAINAAGMTALAVIEQVSGGWGFGGRMFTAVYFGGIDLPILSRFLVFFAAFLFFFFAGSLFATIYQRWRVLGMLVFFGAMTLLVLGLVTLVTVQGHWPVVGEGIATAGATGIAAWSLVPTVLSAAVGFVIIRRTTPKG